MPIDIVMPQLSPTMTEGRLAKWLVQAGDKVLAGQVIAEVETDKATMEVEASDDGIVHVVLGEVGADLPVGTPIAVLRGPKEEVAADYAPKSKAAAPVAESPKPEAQSQPVPVATPIVAAPVVSSTPVVQQAAGGRVKASPLARRLAQQQGVNLGAVAGSGPHGRITAKDIQQAMGGSRQIVRRGDAVEKLSPMRKAIAARLTQSKQTVPHFYLNASVQMGALMEARGQLNAHLAARNIKLSVNDFVIKACALALADFPAANAAWNGDSIVQFGNVDVSVAVATDGGLITPIVQNADQKSLPAISAEMKQLAADARAGKLKPEQYEGGGFSLSNLGMYGMESFSAIINPPQAAILAVGATQETVLAEGGELFAAEVMKVTLSVDHRVIDGALGAELLARIKQYLEQPAVMLVA
ncbi:MAG: pyruvate dehydrogenase complex dihydrolipoamide acetyltransferase [Pseudomonadaceae bacterium]|nr:pyruvate dehydrogenase complex dihydrolipoamide acetyltransferase [Pseudomonadaceae bacterium]